MAMNLRTWMNDAPGAPGRQKVKKLSDSDPCGKVTAEELANHYGLNAKSYRARLRSEGFRWHDKHQPWDVEVGSPEERQMRTVAEEMISRG